MTIPSSKFLYQPGEYLHFQVMGYGSANVIFLHGFAASLHTWDDLTTFFPLDEFTLHLIDLKGHGHSSRPFGGDYSALQNARLIAGYIHKHKLKDITLIGHSYGGLVGLLTALDCPEIARLILIGTPGFPQKIPKFMRILRLPLIGPLLMSSIPADKIARRGLESVFHQQELITERLVERYAAVYRHKGSARALASTVRQILPPNPAKINARYGTLSTPVLILWGEHDRIVKPWQGKQLNRELKNSRMVIIPDCGHNPHEERPEETFTIILGFLSNC